MSTATATETSYASPENQANGEVEPVADVFEVGWLFVEQYYSFLNTKPEVLHRFYNKTSTLIHGIEGETLTALKGRVQITERIKEHGFNDCRVFVSNMDCQESMNDCILIQVLGEMSNDGRPMQKFVQTFLLAKQPKGYFVLNDILRFLKEDVSDFEGAAAVPASNSVETEPIVPEKGPSGEAESINFGDASGDVSKKPEAHSDNTVAPSSTSSAPAAPVAPVADLPEQSNADANGSVAASASKEPETPTLASTSVSWAAVASKPNKEKDLPTRQALKPAAPTPAPARKVNGSSTSNGTAANVNGGYKKPFPEFHSAYIRNVSYRVDEALLKKELEKIGVLTHYQVEKGKNCAFVDFIDEETLKAALQVHELKVGTEVVIIDERKRGGAKNKPNQKRTQSGPSRKNGQK